MKFHLSERGQALILIVLGIVGLVGLTALAVDGGMTYSDRRQAQNAADTAALAAALAKARGDAQWQNRGLAIAANNGYDNNGATNTVQIYNPPLNGPYAAHPQRQEYIQVVITSRVATTFARVLGVAEMVNTVQAVARSKPGQTGEMFFGNAMVSLAPTGCRSTFVHGTSDTQLIGGGLFVNSNHPTCAFEQNGNGGIYGPGITVVGGASVQKQSKVQPFPPTTGAMQIPYPPPFLPPEPTCSGNAVKTGNRLSPGNVGNFPPSGVKYLDPGIYCVSGDFRMNAHDEIHGTGVLIFMQSGTVHFNGNATIDLAAATSGPYAGLLIYQSINNSNRFTLNGNSDSVFVGTILVPGAEIQINGTQNSDSYQSQIIGFTLDLIGTSDAVVRYQDSQNYDAYYPPEIELTQ